jgi:hypothetical protein
MSLQWLPAARARCECALVAALSMAVGIAVGAALGLVAG